MNILLVEDNDLDVEILKRSLKKLEAPGAIVRAHDGIEALEMLQSAERSDVIPDPFVILLDINMPRMNGHEFLAELRDTAEISDARVFVFTTSDSPRDISLAYRNFASGYIVKPNSSSELVDVLSSLQSFWDKCKDPPGPAFMHA